jgi:hypothetical protein
VRGLAWKHSDLIPHCLSHQVQIFTYPALQKSSDIHGTPPPFSPVSSGLFMTSDTWKGKCFTPKILHWAHPQKS